MFIVEVSLHISYSNISQLVKMFILTHLQTHVIISFPDNVTYERRSRATVQTAMIRVKSLILTQMEGHLSSPVLLRDILRRD